MEEQEEKEEEGNGEQLGRSGPFEGRGSLSVSNIASSESLTAPATGFATSTPIKQNKENSGAVGFHLSPTCLSLAATETKRLCLRDSTYEVRREGRREGGRGGREGREGGREGGRKEGREGGREGREGGREGREGGEGGREGGREGREGKEGGKGGEGREGVREGGREGKREGRQKGGRDRERHRERERQRLQHFSSCLLPLPQTSSGSDSEAWGDPPKNFCP